MDMQWVNHFWSQVEEKLRITSEEIGAGFPYTTKSGKYNAEFANHEGITWWTNGFWGGMMWLLYTETKDERYLQIARSCEERLDKAFDSFSGLNHDMGFMWLPTAVADYKLTGNPRARERGMHAATILAGRFNPAGRYINAWNGPSMVGWAIIDCMMNLPLLYWASEESGDPRYANIAKIHADMVQNTFIRSDGSSEHVVVLDPMTGEVQKKLGGQGYAEGSSWSRGQAWALYGFTVSYIYTGNERYLKTAKKCADYFISQLDETGVPDIDFCAPKTPILKDASAGAIAASGLVQLAEVVDEDKREFYLAGAEKILRGLEKNCNFTLQEQSILQNCSEAYHKEKGHHMPIIYGDYYLIEALLRLKSKDVLRMF